MAISSILIKQVDVNGSSYLIDAEKFAGKTEQQ